MRRPCDRRAFRDELQVARGRAQQLLGRDFAVLPLRAFADGVALTDWFDLGYDDSFFAELLRIDDKNGDMGEMEANSISEQVIGNLINRQVDFDSFGEEGMHVQRSTKEGTVQRTGSGHGPEIGLEGGTTSSDLANQIKNLS